MISVKPSALHPNSGKLQYLDFRIVRNGRLAIDCGESDFKDAKIVLGHLMRVAVPAICEIPHQLMPLSLHRRGTY